MVSNAIHRRNARQWMEKSKQNRLLRPLRPLTLDSPTSCDEFAQATIERPRERVNRFESLIRREVRLRISGSQFDRAFDSLDVSQSVLANFFARAAIGQFELEHPDQLARLLVTMACNKLVSRVQSERRQIRDIRRLTVAPDALDRVAAPSVVRAAEPPTAESSTAIVSPLKPDRDRQDRPQDVDPQGQEKREREVLHHGRRHLKDHRNLRSSLAFGVRRNKVRRAKTRRKDSRVSGRAPILMESSFFAPLIAAHSAHRGHDKNWTEEFSTWRTGRQRRQRARTAGTESHLVGFVKQPSEGFSKSHRAAGQRNRDSSGIVLARSAGLSLRIPEVNDALFCVVTENRVVMMCVIPGNKLPAVVAATISEWFSTREISSRWILLRSPGISSAVGGSFSPSSCRNVTSVPECSENSSIVLRASPPRAMMSISRSSCCLFGPRVPRTDTRLAIGLLQDVEPHPLVFCRRCQRDFRVGHSANAKLRTARKRDLRGTIRKWSDHLLHGLGIPVDRRAEGSQEKAVADATLGDGLN